MRNPYTALLRILPQRPLLIGVVESVGSGDALVEILGSGAKIRALGAATVGQRVFVQGGVIQSTAPSLPFYAVTV
jgi:hypothetical protein